MAYINIVLNALLHNQIWIIKEHLFIRSKWKYINNIRSFWRIAHIVSMTHKFAFFTFKKSCKDFKGEGMISLCIHLGIQGVIRLWWCDTPKYIGVPHRILMVLNRLEAQILSRRLLQRTVLKSRMSINMRKWFKSRIEKKHNDVYYIYLNPHLCSSIVSAAPK